MNETRRRSERRKKRLRRRIDSMGKVLLLKRGRKLCGKRRRASV
jgi:hypothetical protein